MKTLFGPTYAVLTSPKVVDCSGCGSKLEVVDKDLSKSFEFDEFVGKYTLGIAVCIHCGKQLWIPIDKKPESELNWFEKLFGRSYSAW